MRLPYFRSICMRGLILLAIAVVLVPALVGMAVQHVRFYRGAREREKTASLVVARSLASSVGLYIERTARETAILAQALNRHPFAGPQAMNYFLAYMANTTADIEALYWANSSGKIVASSLPAGRGVGADLSFRPYIQEIIGGRETVVSDLFTGSITGQQIFVIAHGIRSERAGLETILIATVNREHLVQLLREAVHAEGARVAIFDKQGNLVARHPEIVSKEWHGGHPLLPDASKGREGTGVYISPIDGEEMFGAHVRVPHLGWVVGVSRPYSDVFGPIYSSLMIALLITLAVTAASGGMALLLTHMIARGIRNLQTHTAAVSRGNLAYRTQPHIITEVDALGRDLNRMTRRLHESQQSLGLAQERMQRLFDSNIFGIVVADEVGNIYEANDYYLHLLGYTREEFEQGQLRWTAATPAEWHEADENCIKELRATGICKPYEKEYFRRDGSRVSVILSDTLLPEGKILAFVEDITERRKAERLLEEREAFFSKALYSSLNGIYIYDVFKQTHVFVNSQFTNLTGYTLEEIQQSGGERLSRHFLPDDLERISQYIEQVSAAADGEVVEIEYQFLCKNGSWRWFFSRETPFLRNPDGTVSQHIGSFLDITERKEAEHALLELKQTLEQRVVERTAETQRLADELRALASELGQAEQRERKRLARVLHDHLQQLLVAARIQLESLKREQKPEQYRSVAQGVDSILKEAVEASRSLAVDLSPPVLHETGLVGGLSWLAARMQQKNNLHVELRAETNAEPATEEMRFFLFECVRELLLNVAKHAKAGSAEVTLLRTPENLIRLVVYDTGKGFNPDELRHRPPGASFGLFSIQQRLTQIGGTMEIETAPGKGTRVILSVPAGLRAEPAVAAAPPFEEKEKVRVSRTEERCRVIIVDDHKIMREGLRGLLRFEPDIDVAGEAADGQQALRLVEELKPDVVIMDVNLGGMSGIEVTRQLTERRLWTKVIGLSMHADADIARAMHDAGAVAYLTKGGPSQDLLSAIRAACQEKPRTGEVEDFSV